MGSVQFHNGDITYRLRKLKKHRDWIISVIRKYSKRPGDLNFIFTSDQYLLKINREYLNHNYFTDVITFDYGEGPILSGDIFISIDTVKKNASEFGVLLGEELRRVMIHGVLHLAGFDDHTNEDKSRMRIMENEALHLWLNS